MGCATSDSLPMEQEISQDSPTQGQSGPISSTFYQSTFTGNDLPFKCQKIQKYMNAQQIVKFFYSSEERNILLEAQNPLINAQEQKIISSFGMQYKRPHKPTIVHQNKPTNLYAAQQIKPNDQNLPSRDDLLTQMKDALMNVPQFNVILSKEFFEYLFNIISKNYWNHDQKSQLLKLLLNYMKYSLSELSEQQRNQTKYNLSNFGQTFGKQIDKLLKKVKIRNLYAIQSIKYLKFFERKIFNLDQVQQIAQMVKQIKQFSYNNTSVLAYLAYYLLKCCEDLEESGFTANQINQKLKPTVKRLKQIFSPRETIEESQYNKNMKDQISKIQQFDKKAPNKKFYFKYADREMELSKYIMDIVSLAKSKHELFTQLTSRICFQHGGFGYKANLKLRDITEKLPLLRVKEKLTEEIIKQYYKQKTYDAKTMAELRQAQISYLEETMKTVNQKLHFIEFIVSDMLRGKCMFSTIAQIVEVVNQLKRTNYGDAEVVKISNRLGGITKDVMVKLKFGELTAQFQVALCFNQVQNHIHHKMYQVERSKVFTPITMLSIWFESISKEFIQDLQGVITENKNKEKLQVQLKKLKQMMKQSEEKNIQKISCEKKDYDDFKRVKQSIVSCQIPLNLKNRSLLREGICLWSIGQLNEAENALIRYHKQQQIDLSSIGYLCLVSYGLGHYSLSYKCFQQALWFDQLYRKKKNVQIFNKNVPRIIIGQNIETITKLLVELGKFQIANKNIAHNSQTKLNFDGVYRTYLQQIVFNNKGEKHIVSLQGIIFQKKFQESRLITHFQSYVDCVELFLHLYCDSLSYKKSSVQSMMKIKRSTYQNEKGIEDIKTIQTREDYIYYYLSLGDFRSARKQFKRYIFFVKFFIPKNSIHYMNACLTISRFHEKQQNYEKSQKYLVQALNIAKQKSLKRMKIKKLLAIVQIKNGKPGQALQSLNVSLEICKELNPLNVKFLISVHSNIGLAHYQLRNLQKAKQSIFEARSIILEKLKQETFPIKQNNIWVQYGFICAQILFQQKNYKLALYSAFFATFFYQCRQNQYRQQKCQALHLMAKSFYQLGLYKQSYNHYQQVISLEEKCVDFVGLGKTLLEKYEKFSSMMERSQRKQTLQKALQIFKRLKGKEISRVEDLIKSLNLNSQQKAKKLENNSSMDMDEFERDFLLRRIQIYEKSKIENKVMKLYEQLIQRQKSLTGEKSAMYGQTLMKFYHQCIYVQKLPKEKQVNILRQAKQIYQTINNPYIYFIDQLLQALETNSNLKQRRLYLGWYGWRFDVPSKYVENRKMHYDNYFKKTPIPPNPKLMFFTEPDKEKSNLQKNLCMIY